MVENFRSRLLYYGNKRTLTVFKKGSFQRRNDDTCSHHPGAASASCNSCNYVSQTELLQKRWLINIRRDYYIAPSSWRVWSRYFSPTHGPGWASSLSRTQTSEKWSWKSFIIAAPQSRVWERTEPPSTEPVQTDEEVDAYFSSGIRGTNHRHQRGRAWWSSAPV